MKHKVYRKEIHQMRKPARLVTLVITVLLASCGGSPESEKTTEKPIEPSRMGGVFKMPIESYFKCIEINEIQKHEETQIYGQIYEGLVKYHPKTLEIQPCLAKSWEVGADGMTYTFELRDDVYFQDNACFAEGKGRKMTAEDVVYSLGRIFEPKNTNSGYSIFKNTVVGGDEYYLGKVDSITGISADGNNVRIELKNPGSSFLQKLATIFGSVIPKEALEQSTPEHIVLVGTGPFGYDQKNSTSENVRLFKNNNYYMVDERGDKLPYLDSLNFIYYENMDEQMELFWNENLAHIPQVPVSKISEVLEEKIGDFESKPPKYILTSEPQLTVGYLEMNMQNPVFRKKKVRQALSMAINRKKIVEKVLKNQAYEAGKFGITPPLSKIFENYDFEGIEDVSYAYNPEKAKQLLAEAGYPDGKNFPVLKMQFVTGQII